MAKNTIQELEQQAEAIMDLRFTARDLLTKAIHSEDECTNIGTGGLVAYKMPWGLQLTFQLTWANSF